MSDEDRRRLLARREEIERGALNDQFGWFDRLSKCSGEVREQALRALVPPAVFEEWRMLSKHPLTAALRF